MFRYTNYYIFLKYTMNKKRSYQQYCSIARALDQVGERWTLLIVRDLLGGPRRYKDLQESLAGIGSNRVALAFADEGTPMVASLSAGLRFISASAIFILAIAFSALVLRD